eukprot:TRINITY_DN5311_c0_g1_i1.p1 TRINITY_DN5311_c0_g1~~TRINITY_DN5311_c0_g1_i1.p1  ORF type:complete len:844 (+),score=203.19 TRINITY_DN5311_c0_g1_i1:212-2533(+)
MEFKAYKETDKVRVIVMDYDVGKKDDAISECTFTVGRELNEYDGTYELQCHADFRTSDKHRLKKYGTIRLKWRYNTSALIALLAIPDVKDDTEDLDVGMFEVMQVAMKLLKYGYRAAVVLFWIIDNFMWVRPFACASQLLLVTILCFYTKYGVDTLVPASFAMLLYWTKKKLKSTGPMWADKMDFTAPMPAQPLATVPLWRLRKTLPVLKEITESSSASLALKQGKLLKVAYIWCEEANRLIEKITGVLTWQKQDFSSFIMNCSFAAIPLVWFIGIPLEYWRYGAFLASFYLYVLFPVYYNYPAIKRKYGIEVWVTKGVGAAKKWEEKAKEKLKKKEEEEVVLPKPMGEKAYDEWRTFHASREKIRAKHHGRVREVTLTKATKPILGAFRAASQSPTRPITPNTIRDMIKVHILQARGLPPNIPYLVKFFNAGSKFRTRSSTTLTWNVSYEIPLQPDDLNAEIQLYEFDTSSELRLIASGRRLMVNKMHEWMKLQLNGAAGFCELRVCYLFAASNKGTDQSPGFNMSQSPEQRGVYTPFGNGNPPGKNTEFEEIKKISGDPTRLREVYERMKKVAEVNPDDAEVLWWFARACYDWGCEVESKDRKGFFEEGLAAAGRCREVAPELPEGWKWSAILLGKMGDLISTTDKIKNTFTIKEHAERAAELNPSDPTTLHVLGAWHYNVAAIPWATRKLAETLFATPPTSSYGQALPYLLRSEAAGPNNPTNQLLLGDTYSAMGNKAEAQIWYSKVANMTAQTNLHRAQQKEARQKLGM